MMNMLEAVLRRPRTVITVMIIILAAGISAYMTLPKESQPSIDVPYLYVSVSQTGVSPADANRLLVRPLETELKGIEGLESMRSVATNGHASVILEFNVNFDKDEALADAKDRVDRAKPNLPDDATDPTVQEVDISEFGSITTVLYGDVPERALYERANELKRAFEGLDTVLEVEMSGDREEVLEVVVDQLKLESYGLTTNQLFDALQRNNMVVPAGSLDTGQGEFAIEVPGLIENINDIQTLPIKSSGDTVVTFSDVATIQRTFKDATEYTRVNGQPAVVLSVSKRLGANIIDLSDAVHRVTEEHAANWPQNLEYSYMLDQAKFANDMFTSLRASVLTAIALVAVVCVALLGIRPALMIGLAIPVSFMTSFLLLQTMGMTINMMIMFGLVLTVGMLVDGAVVVVEYAERKIAEGMDRREAFIRAAKLMFWPIMASTGTTLAAFLPLLLWPGIIGKFMSYLPIMVIVTLIASFITAMIFLPAVGALIARKKVSEQERESAQALSGSADFDPGKVKGVLGAYVRMLSVLVRHPILTLTAGFGLIATIFVVFANNPTGVVAFPQVEPDYATVAVTSRGNYSPVQIRDLLVEVEREVLKVDGIEDVVTNFGSTGAVASVPTDTVGNFQLELEPYEDRRKATEIFAEIRQRTADISGVGVQLVAQEEGPPSGKDVNLRVEAETYAELEPAVAKIRQYMETGLGDMIEVSDTRPLPGIDWEITIDREQAAQYGIGVRELSPYIQLVTNGVEIGSYRPDDATDELEIRVRLPEQDRSFESLDHLKVITESGLVPVSNFVTRKAVPKVADIQRWNSAYYMEVAGNVAPDAGVYPAAKVEKLKTWIDGQQWPGDVDFVFTGADEQTQETNQFMMQAGLGALFLMFLILLTQFNSFYQVFVTLSTVIMSTAGVLLGMMITGQPFSAIMTGIGIVSLAGIVVNNSIVLIDTYNRFHREQGVAPVNAVIMTGAQRLRPVIMTTATTVLGLLPMAIGVSIDFFAPSVELNAPSGAWWTYLSTALVSGLTFSTLLTLVMVPVMIVAPGVIWASIKRVSGGVAGFFQGLGQVVTGRRRQQPAPDTGDAAIPAGVDSSKQYISADQTGLVTTERNGVTVVSRQAAE